MGRRDKQSANIRDLAASVNKLHTAWVQGFPGLRMVSMDCKVVGWRLEGRKTLGLVGFGWVEKLTLNFENPTLLVFIIIIIIGMNA